jgi:AAA domain, putative AbiEii toxin, Type IV TA system/Overcoming lysogenization defect protein-like, TOPRIM domain
VSATPFKRTFGEKKPRWTNKALILRLWRTYRVAVHVLGLRYVQPMIEHLHLKSSSSSGQPALCFELEPSITIFVGPNNSGKSQLLREIYSFCTAGSSQSLILERLEFLPVAPESASADFKRLKRPLKHNERVGEKLTPVRLGSNDTSIRESNYLLGRTKPNENLNYYAAYHLSHLTVSLDAQARTSLLQPINFGDLTNPSSPMARLYVDNPKREAWRTTVHDALGLYPSITSLESGKLSVHFGNSPPTGERTHEDDIIQWVRAARSVDAVSDGVRAFAGILLQVYGGDPQVIVVDEPEAFLHPSIARRLGKELATAARSEKKTVFAATHSADFLMGAIQSGAVVNIVRLTYSSDVATARLLPNEQLKLLMTDPLLRSVGVLSGLFFEHVIVTEGDTDRAFYQEINERLASVNDPRAIPNALFLNAGGNGSMHQIITPLRSLGIPAASIVDIDFVKNDNHSWTQQVAACHLPEPQRQPLDALRKVVLDALVDAAPCGVEKPRQYFKRHGGVKILDEGNRAAADSLFDDLDLCGLFVVRIGEVEAWLSELKVPAKEAGWRAAIFAAMGNDPDDTSYVSPAEGDVWDFIGKLAIWLKDPQRAGIPK